MTCVLVDDVVHSSAAPLSLCAHDPDRLVGLDGPGSEAARPDGERMALEGWP